MVRVALPPPRPGLRTLSAGAVAAFLLLSVAPRPAAAECGAPDAPCLVSSGQYFAAAPPWQPGDPPRGAVLFLHGAGGSGEAVVANADLAGPVTARGFVLLAPSGSPREGREGRFWSLGAQAPVRDEAAFLDEVLADAVDRFHLDRSQVVLAGFSMGAGMVWQLACREPDEFAAFAPGWRDDAVPLEGEDRGDGVESAAFEGAELWRQVNDCADAHAASYADLGEFWQRTWTGCAPGSALAFVLHPDGHEVPAGWADMALDWFEGLTPPSH